MTDGSSTQRWKRGGHPQQPSPRNEESNNSESDGEWQTVQAGRRPNQKRRQQLEPESAGVWSRGQDVREPKQQDGIVVRKVDSRSVRGNAWRGRSPRGPLSNNQRQQEQQRTNSDESNQFRPSSSDISPSHRGSNRGGGSRGGRGGWRGPDGEGTAGSEFRGGGGGGRGGRGGFRGGGRGGWRNHDDEGEDQPATNGFRGGGVSGRSRGARGGFSSRYEEHSARGGGSDRGGLNRSGGDNRGQRGGGPGRNFDGGHVGFQRGTNRGRGGRGGREMATAPRDLIQKNKSWNFWTLLCGSSNSQIVFRDYQGHRKERTGRGSIQPQVPLFQPTSDEEVCQNFREKLQSIAASVAECQELSSERCHLEMHLRVGDLFLFHRSFRFDSRPGPKLGDFSELLDETRFPDASNKMERFFNADEEVSRPRQSIKSTFVTEKSVGNHATLEAFLSMRDFEEVRGLGNKTLLTATLNGQQNKFELSYNLEDLTIQNIKLITNKWNLNIVTAKGTNYQGSFHEVADFRLQFDASVLSDTDENISEGFTAEVFQKEDVQHLFERIGESPPVPETSAGENAAPDLWADSDRYYRVKFPHLAEKLDYIREQFNRTFVRRHDRWPFVVMLRQFKFYKLANPVAAVFHPLPGVELRVSGELDCPLDREDLDNPEFVSYMWECCQLMQDLVAASLEI